MTPEEILQAVRQGQYDKVLRESELNNAVNNVYRESEINQIDPEELFRKQRLAEINARMNPERYAVRESEMPRLIDVSGYYDSPNVQGSFDTRGGSVIQEPTQGTNWSPYEDVTSYGGRIGANIPVNNGILSGGIIGQGYNVDVNAPGFQGTFKDKGITGADVSYGNNTGEVGLDYYMNENMPDDFFLRGILNF